MRNKLYKLLLFLPSLFYYSLIFFLSSKSYQVNIEIFFFDKGIHIIEFGVLGFLLSLGIFNFSLSFKNKFILVFTIGSFLAVLDEIHQFFVPMRTMEAFDLAADILGIGLGFFIFNYIYKKTGESLF